MTAPALEGLELRHLSFDLELRAEDATAEDGDWSFEALAVPYDQTARVADWTLGTEYERFAPESVEPADVVTIWWEHDHQLRAMPVGRLDLAACRHTPEGWRVRGLISRTDKGAELRTLMRDGVVTSLSVGFRPLETTVENEGTPEATAVRNRAQVAEVSVTPRPVYTGAAVTEVRHQRKKDTAMTTPDTELLTRAQVDAEFEKLRADLTGGLSALERQIATMAPGGGAAAAQLGAQFRSYGEYAKAYASGDDAAAELYRAWTGGTSADTAVTSTWVGDITRLVTQARKLTNLYGVKPLPEDGMTLEYAKLSANTVAAGKQSAEGELLPYGKLVFTTDTAAVLTYGGYTTMTRQEVERAKVSVLDRVFEALGIAYAQATEAAVRAAQSAAAAHTIAGATTATYDGWIDFLVDAAMHLDGKGLTADAVVISPDVFKVAAKLKSGDRYLLDRTQGTINVTGLSGDVMGVPFTLIPGTGITDVVSSTAITPRESSGAPARLTDGDVTNLSGAYSCYGYMAVAVEDPKAIVRKGA